MELFELAKILVPTIFGTIIILALVSFIAYKVNSKKKKDIYTSSKKEEVKIIFHHSTCNAGGCERQDCLGAYCKNNLANRQSTNINRNHFNMVTEPLRSWR